MPATIVRSEVHETQFGFYSDDEIRQLSVCKITSPEARDGLGHPTQGGLYDPKLGPIEHLAPCPTCNLAYANCPGASDAHGF